MFIYESQSYSTSAKFNKDPTLLLTMNSEKKKTEKGFKGVPRAEMSPLMTDWERKTSLGSLRIQ